MRASFHNNSAGNYYSASQCACSSLCTVQGTPLQQLLIYNHLMTVGLLNTTVFQYVKCQDQWISKTCRSTFIFCSSLNLHGGGEFLHFACHGGGAHPYSPVSYATAHKSFNQFEYTFISKFMKNSNAVCRKTDGVCNAFLKKNAPEFQACLVYDITFCVKLCCKNKTRD